MNIFEITEKKLIKIIKKASANGKIIIPDDLKNINVEASPEKFNCDLSTNVAMVLSKLNNKKPIDLANEIKIFFENELQNIKQDGLVSRIYVFVVIDI